MNNFEIQDAQLLLEQANNLATLNSNIQKVREELENCCSQIDGAWQSSTEDKSTYLANIQRNLAKLENLGEAIKLMAGELTTFGQQAIKEAYGS